MLPRPKEMRGCGHSARASHARFASRLRRDLQAEGVVISEMGKASSGRHTVVTLRLPSGAKSALEQLAARLQVSISFVAEAGSR